VTIESEVDETELGQAAKPSSLENLLHKNIKIKRDLDETGTNLMAVNEVLKSDEVSVDSLSGARSRNEASEQQVVNAATEMNHVNLKLADEVGERAMLESDLSDAKANLLESRYDLKQSRRETEDIRQVALKDALTGLPNRLAFNQRLEHGLSQAKRHGWGLAVFFIDVDKFKSINDSYGHDLGDQVLKMVAARLTSFLRDEDMVSRWGGDEFVCLLQEVKNHADMTRLAEKLVTRIAEVCILDEVILSVHASIGISVYPEHGDSAFCLIKNADAAMYEAKGSDNRVVLFRKSDTA